VTVPRRTRVKLCGMTSADDVALAVAAGADAVGVIVTESARRVALPDVPAVVAALPPFVAKIAVVGDAAPDDLRSLAALGFTFQFTGDESAAACERAAAGAAYLKVRHVEPERRFTPADVDALDAELAAYPRATWLFDSKVAGKRGGTGVTFRWDGLEALARRRAIVVSGGLTPDNVAACVRAVRPYAVDVRSGVETDGRKDFDKMRALVRAVREADAQA
jgi:phosphoribosylanthranilate isomerase